MKSGTEMRGWKMCTLLLSLGMVVNDMDSTCMTRSCARSKSNMEVTLSPFLLLIVVTSPKVRRLVGFGTSYM